MLAISECASTAGVAQGTIAIFGVLEKLPLTAGRPECVLCWTLCTTYLLLTHDDFWCGAWRIVTVCPLNSDDILLYNTSPSRSVKSDVDFNAREILLTRFLVPHYWYILWRMYESKISLKLSPNANLSNISLQRRLFATNASPYCYRLIPARCASCMITDSVSTTIFCVEYFSNRNFSTYMWIIRNLGLTVVFQDGALSLESAPNLAVSTVDAALSTNKQDRHLAAPREKQWHHRRDKSSWEIPGAILDGTDRRYVISSVLWNALPSRRDSSISFCRN